MSKRPFMQLYVADFLGDTLHLSAEEVGAYLLLLMTMWQRNGTLPSDEQTLSRISRIAPERWPSVWGALADYFTVEDGKISNERLSEELGKFARKSAARSEAGRRGAEAKALKNNNRGQAIAKQMHKHLPDTRYKKGNASLVPTERSERVDRNAEPEVFAACLSSTGETVPDFITAKSFPLAIVAEARKRLAH